MARVLCIDDEPGLRRLVRRILEQDGHVVSTASDGIEGLRLACTELYDLVVLGLLLPDLPGAAVLSALVERHPTQRVLVLSAAADTESRVTCLERGAVDYVSKPFVVREFRARLGDAARPVGVGMSITAPNRSTSMSSRS